MTTTWYFPSKKKKCYFKTFATFFPYLVKSLSSRGSFNSSERLKNCEI